MQQITPISKQYGEYIFYIYPFPALKAANISGELVSMISPFVLSIAPAALKAIGSDDNSVDNSVLDFDLTESTSTMINAFSSLSGDKLEKLMKTLLVEHRNISFEHEQERTVKWLDENGLNDVFIGDITDMYLLAVEVIKVNFNGFFEKLGNQFGGQTGVLSRLMQSITDTSTAADSQI